ncbi:MAG TPA: helix-turn-helix domain-containing protein [Candidatus Limnocylindrales bacterium]|nr:helix-turn-helix domain-containing protein [Candidatus Limnocylindrales bacterium]
MTVADDRLLDQVLHAIADETRRRLLSHVSDNPGLTTAQLAELIPTMTRWGVMKHLEVLRAAGLIQAMSEGRNTRHFVERSALAPVKRYLESAG